LEKDALKRHLFFRMTSKLSLVLFSISIYKAYLSLLLSSQPFSIIFSLYIWVKRKIMIRIIFTIFLVINSVYIFCQDYTPLAIENATWFITPYGETAETPYAYRIDGDSIHNNILYKKLYYNTLEYVYNEFTMINQIGFVSRHLIGLIRDDINNRKVYYINLTNIFGTNESECTALFQDNIDQEVLLYDFDLTVNDTIDNCISSEVEFGDLKITSDTIINMYQKNRRTLQANGNSIIEGIGFDRGLLSPLSFPFHAGKGTSFYYCVGSLFDCNVITSTDDLLTNNEITVYPNPTNDILTIKTDRIIDQLKINKSESFRSWILHSRINN